MNTAVTPFTPEFTPVLPIACKNKRAIYFDIETTGLSAQSSYVYLIGCACEEPQGYLLTQWLCTEPSEEKELLRLFFTKVKAYDIILHYNGTGFDLPFLEKRAKRYGLPNPLSALESLDIYATARNLKKLFHLPNLKLKTMEQFFGFPRTDVFSGSDLIEVYTQFLGLHHLNALTNHSKAEEENTLAQILLLHNAEDVMNLPSLTILCFLNNLANVLEPDTLQADVSDTARNQILTLTYPLPNPIPRDISFSLSWENSSLLLELSATQGTLSLSLPVYSGELKYFHSNPSDYYYLPLEDCAMHKSIASFVEKKYRRKATADTCYTRKTGAFLPFSLTSPPQKKLSAAAICKETLPEKKEAQAEACASLPCFLSDYKSSFTYTPLTEELLNSPVLLTDLAKKLLSTLLR